MDLTAFRALSFDCYGTLIDWEAGLLAVLRPWAADRGADLDDERLLAAYAAAEEAVERDARREPYPAILAEAFRRAGAALGVPVGAAWARRLGDSVRAWPAFPDSRDALAALAERYELIILSNVDRAGFAASNERLHGRFAAVITAEDVGAYKPADQHFEALWRALGELDVDRAQLLHVAQSLFHDHVPAKRHGLRSVWINRRHAQPGWGATPAPPADFSFDLEFPSMAAFAAAVDAAWH